MPAQIDGAYVRRIQRKHAASLRKQIKKTASPSAATAVSAEEVGGVGVGVEGLAWSFADDEAFVDGLIIDDDKLNGDDSDFTSEINTFPW